MNFKTSQIEKKLGFKLTQNTWCLGIDLASTTGLALLKEDNGILKIEIMDVIKLPSVDKDDEKSEQYVDKLIYMLKWIRDWKKEKLLYKEKGILILENSYLGINAYTFGQLKMMGGIAFAELFDLFKDIKIIFATTARKEIGFKSQLPKKSKREDKKKELIKFVNFIFDTKLKGDNLCDAIILSLCGLKEEI